MEGKGEGKGKGVGPWLQCTEGKGNMADMVDQVGKRKAIQKTVSPEGNGNGDGTGKREGKGEGPREDDNDNGNGD